MNRPRHIEGWTLVETLVGMIIAGVVFLAVMDGLVLFNRYTGQKTMEIIDNMRIYEGYSHLEHLTASSDSLSSAGDAVTLYREGEPVAELSERDSLLVAVVGAMQDTLIRGVSELRVFESRKPGEADSLCFSIVVPEGDNIQISFPVRLSVEEQAMELVREHEKQFAYEEP